MADLIPSEQGEDNAKDALDIVKSVTKQNPRLFNGIKKEKQEEIVKAFSVEFMHIQKSHSGPLPDPESLEHYNNIIENGAERIMQMAEKEQAFRHDHTKTVARRRLNQVSTGQWFGFLLSLLCILGGLYLAYSGKNTAGIAVIITSLVALVGAFFYGRKEAADKEKQKSNRR